MDATGTEVGSGATLVRLTGTAQISLPNPRHLRQFFLNHETLKSDEECYQIVLTTSSPRDCIVSFFEDSYTISAPPKSVSSVHTQIRQTLTSESLLEFDIGTISVSTGTFRANSEFTTHLKNISDDELAGGVLKYHHSDSVRILFNPDIQVGSIVFDASILVEDVQNQFNEFLASAEMGSTDLNP